MAGRTPLTRLLSAVLLLAAACAAPPHRPARSWADVHLKADTEVIEARVPANATLVSLLRAQKMSEELATAVVERAKDVFDLRRLRAHQPYRVVRTLDGLLRRFEYQIDSDRYLRVTVAGPPAPDLPAFDVDVVPYEKHRALVDIRGTIDEERSSLVAAMEDTGEGVQLAIALADIFGGEIDFNTELRSGDSFEVLFERELREDRFAGYGAIVAAEFNNAGRRLRAFRFAPPGGRPAYYDDRGRSLKRFFLRSPLPFEPRITSRFSRRRLHPILGISRAHLGVDYGAPVGTPVIAVANGLVAAAGWDGGSGRMVRLRHAGGYETFYLHLSSIAEGVRPGSRVAQGQRIGRVGATGLATGPHLDYRVRRNGVFVNPLLEQRRMPPGEPIPAQSLAAFQIERDRALGRFLKPQLARAEAVLGQSTAAQP